MRPAALFLLLSPFFAHGNAPAGEANPVDDYFSGYWKEEKIRPPSTLHAEAIFPIQGKPPSPWCPTGTNTFLVTFGGTALKTPTVPR